jgi:hypothetical protein
MVAVSSGRGAGFPVGEMVYSVGGFDELYADFSKNHVFSLWGSMQMGKI